MKKDRVKRLINIANDVLVGKVEQKMQLETTDKFTAGMLNVYKSALSDYNKVLFELLSKDEQILKKEKELGIE